MPVLARQFLLRAPPDAVWAQLVEPDRWPAFVRHLIEAGWSPGSGAGADPSVDIRASYRGLLSWAGPVGCRIDEAGRDIRVWQRSNPVVEASGRLRVRPAAAVADRTLVRIQAEYRALSPLAGLVVAAKLDGYLEKTARALERAAATG